MLGWLKRIVPGGNDTANGSQYEKRSAGSGFTAEIMAARESYIAGRRGIAELTATAQSCVSLWEGAFALADVSGTDILDRRSLALIARSLALRGEAVFVIDDTGLIPCAGLGFAHPQRTPDRLSPVRLRKRRRPIDDGACRRGASHSHRLRSRRALLRHRAVEAVQPHRRHVERDRKLARRGLRKRPARLADCPVPGKPGHGHGEAGPQLPWTAWPRPVARIRDGHRGGRAGTGSRLATAGRFPGPLPLCRDRKPRLGA